MTITRFVLLSILFSFFSITCFSQENYNVLFDSDQHKLTTKEINKLEEVFEKKLVYAMTLKLVGHTDNVGSDDYNQQLSQRRVENIKQTLIQLGFDGKQIQTTFFGENKPENSNKNEAEKRLNRRVTIEWELPPPSIEEEESSIEHLYRLLELDKQSFCIDPNRDTILILEQGTILSIPANAFTTSSTECVTFKAKEVYSKSDMIRENLNTTSNGDLLESGGMVYTEAADSKGNPLNLANGKSIGVLMPTDTARNDMQLFYGERDPHHTMNWVADNNTNFIPVPASEITDCINLPDQGGVFCQIFFCRLFGRMGVSFAGMFNKEIRKGNQDFRAMNRTLKPSFTALKKDVSIRCDSLLKVYGVDNWEDLADTLAKIKVQNSFEQMEEGTVENGTMGSLIYNVARVNKLGWINCDAFSNVPASRKITMLTDLRTSPKVDCKAVFRSKNSVMTASYLENKYAFVNIPDGLSIWLIALKYEKKKAYIYLEKTKTAKNAAPIEFREISIDDLKLELERLND